VARWAALGLAVGLSIAELARSQSAADTPSAASADWDLLVLDLGGEGLFLCDRFYPVTFDLGHGPERLSWTAAGRDEAFLWWDGNANQRVDGARELVGSGFGWPALPVVSTGFEVLAFLDQPAQGGNGDGRLDARDFPWRRLMVWVDRDHDGEVDPAETGTLQQRGIASIDTAFVAAGKVDGGLNQRRYDGHFRFEQGGRRPVRRSLDGSITAVAFDRLQSLGRVGDSSMGPAASPAGPP
jgi:hypothetical protein